MSKTLIARLQLDAARKGAFPVMGVDVRSELLELRAENLMIEDVERGLRLADGNLRLAAGHHGEPAVPWVLEPVCGHGAKNRRHHHGYANIRIAFHIRAVKSRWRDSDDANRIVIEDGVLADDCWIAAESPLPIAITEDRNGMGPGRAVVFGPDQAA